MKRTLFVGDINVDLILGGLPSLPVPDKEITCASYELCMGSSAVIAACAYAALGGQTWFVGLAGQDEHGQFMLHGLESCGINTELIRRTDKVRTGVTVNLIHQNTRTQVTYPGTIAAFEGEWLDDELLRRFAHLHLAGVYQQTAFRPRITRVLQSARKLGLTSSLDPQWDATEKWEGMDQWLPLLDYLFVNESEALSLTKASSLPDACRRLNERTKCAVVKTGPAGALFYYEGAVQSAAGIPVACVDTTGAGDSFDGGFLYATLERGLPLFEAVRFANATGARSCLFAGGVAARSSAADILEFMQRNSA